MNRRQMLGTMGLTAAAEARPAIVCDDVKNLDIGGLRSQPIAGTQPVVKLAQTKQAFLNNCPAPEGTKTFLEVQGAETAKIVLSGNNFLEAAQAAKSKMTCRKMLSSFREILGRFVIYSAAALERRTVSRYCAGVTLVICLKTRQKYGVSR